MSQKDKQILEKLAHTLDHAVNNRRDYPNVGDLKSVMREIRDRLRVEIER